MRAAAVGIVQQVEVALLHLALKPLHHFFQRPGERAHMHRNVLRLRHEPDVRITDRGGEVAAGVEDLAVGGAQHRLSHFLDDGGQPVLDD